MNRKKRLFFRADGDSKIGLGHVSRCCALAEILKDDFDCCFLIRHPTLDVYNIIIKSCITVEVLEDGKDYIEESYYLAELLKEEIIVLDGYNFNTKYQKIIKHGNNKLISIDDTHSCHFFADVVINHSGGLTRSDYSVEPYTKVFLGPKYAILRPIFLVADRKNMEYTEGPQVFLCMGGADPSNETFKILNELLLIDDNSAIINIVVGSAYNHKVELRKFTKYYKHIRLYESLSAGQMVDVMSASSVAITSPSGVSFEYLSLGGELYLKQTAENQKNIYQYFVTEGLAFDYECYRIKDKNLVDRSLSLQRGIFDGMSDRRLREIFNSVYYA